MLCSRCKLEKDISAFSVKAGSATGFSCICKSCHNEYIRTIWYPANREKQIESSSKWKNANRSRALAKKYGISSEDIEIAIKRADGKCEICGRESVLVLEHEHSGNIIRGFVCKRCNLVLGLLGDKKEDIEKSTTRILKYITNAYRAGE